jgi:uncharacterized membrane protein YeiH
MDFFSIVNIGGTIAFVASGSLAAIRRKLDFFGVLVIAFVTSIGGGTLRDILLGISPVTWLKNSEIIYLIVFVAILTMIFRKSIEKLDKTILLFDTLGLGFFTLKGIEVAYESGLSIPSCIILGTITACFGGVIRDILLNEIPIIFSKEIYATACILGGIMWFLLKNLSVDSSLITIFTFLFVVIIRFLAIKFNITLPKWNL